MVNQFNTYVTWYSPGKGDLAMEGGPLARRNLPAYTLERYLAGNAPYVTVAMDPDIFPFGTTVTNDAFRDAKGNLIPFRVTDTGDAFKGAGLSKMDIATESVNKARVGPNFNTTFNVADSSSPIIGAPTPTSAGATPDPNGCAGLSPSGLAGNKGFNMNNSPAPANYTPLPPGALGGNGVTTNYVPDELKNYGNGRLPNSMLVPLSFGKGRLHASAAAAFEKLIAASGLPFPGVTNSYRTIEEQIRLKREKDSLAATPGRSNHGWGLAIDINNGNRALFDPVLQYFRYNAYKFNIYGLHVDRADKFYEKGFYEGEEWHWEYRGGVTLA
jgi:3D (Asp-Asp-Asp) domain-containing protein